MLTNSYDIYNANCKQTKKNRCQSATDYNVETNWSWIGFVNPYSLYTDVSDKLHFFSPFAVVKKNRMSTFVMF